MSGVYLDACIIIYLIEVACPRIRAKPVDPDYEGLPREGSRQERHEQMLLADLAGGDLLGESSS